MIDTSSLSQRASALGPEIKVQAEKEIRSASPQGSVGSVGTCRSTQNQEKQKKGREFGTKYVVIRNSRRNRDSVGLAAFLTSVVLVSVVVLSSRHHKATMITMVAQPNNKADAPESALMFTYNTSPAVGDAWPQQQGSSDTKQAQAWKFTSRLPHVSDTAQVTHKVASSPQNQPSYTDTFDVGSNHGDAQLHSRPWGAEKDVPAFMGKLKRSWTASQSLGTADDRAVIVRGKGNLANALNSLMSGAVYALLNNRKMVFAPESVSIKNMFQEQIARWGVDNSSEAISGHSSQSAQIIADCPRISNSLTTTLSKGLPEFAKDPWGCSRAQRTIAITMKCPLFLHWAENVGLHKDFERMGLIDEKSTLPVGFQMGHRLLNFFLRPTELIQTELEQTFGIAKKQGLAIIGIETRLVEDSTDNTVTVERRERGKYGLGSKDSVEHFFTCALEVAEEIAQGRRTVFYISSHKEWVHEKAVAFFGDENVVRGKHRISRTSTRGRSVVEKMRQNRNRENVGKEHIASKTSSELKHRAHMLDGHRDAESSAGAQRTSDRFFESEFVWPRTATQWNENARDYARALNQSDENIKHTAIKNAASGGVSPVNNEESKARAAYDGVSDAEAEAFERTAMESIFLGMYADGLVVTPGSVYGSFIAMVSGKAPYYVALAPDSLQFLCNKMDLRNPPIRHTAQTAKKEEAVFPADAHASASEPCPHINDGAGEHLHSQRDIRHPSLPSAHDIQGQEGWKTDASVIIPHQDSKKNLQDGEGMDRSVDDYFDVIFPGRLTPPYSD